MFLLLGIPEQTQQLLTPVSEKERLNCLQPERVVELQEERTVF